MQAARPPANHARKCWHKPSVTSAVQNKSFPQATVPHPHGEGVPEHAGRNQIYTAASYRSKPPGYSEPNRPLCPSSPATFCLRHPTLTCWPFDLEQPNQGPELSSRRRLLRLGGQLPPTTMAPIANQPASPSPLSSFRTKGRLPPLRGPHLCSAAAWLLRLLGCSAPVPSPWPIVSPPPSHPLCYRGHSHPGSDKHACPPREPTAVGQACFKFAGVAPKGWRMSPSCFAGPDGHPRDDIIDPDTRCLFRASIPPNADQPLSAIASAASRGAHGWQSQYSISLNCGTHSVVAWPRNVLPPPPPHHHRHPPHPSINSLSPARRRMLRRASSMCGSDHAHVQALVETSHLEPRGPFRRCYC